MSKQNLTIAAAAAILLLASPVNATAEPDPYFAASIARDLKICNPRLTGIRYSSDEKETDKDYLCMDAKGYIQLYSDIYLVGWSHGVLGFMAGNYIVTDPVRFNK
ncbi:hypothetical protein [Thiothrix subterranea]|uniref:SH3b domain-containing protein n=1 Tax=Thiothrix subterranea TaxID=2735563 RepID=A0AA51MN77_9GAMM|nr:hypothetical protein [Thiothrix subterranea]MDQ5770824.1 hypothetical protein [Thiothrix subterranea]WML87258.1 hypothetical protein RCG00_02605 [Thiothrix subterranea]